MPVAESSSDAKTKIAFFHIGDDVSLPTFLARSIRKHNPDAKIVQVTDMVSPRVAGTDEIQRFSGQADNIMLFRMECFAKLETSSPTWFLDTDMICLKHLDLPRAHNGGEVIGVLQRNFNLDARLPKEANGIDLSHYRERPIGKVFPFVGCVVFLWNSSFWDECLQEYYRLDKSLRAWWGDQEALRRVVQRKDRIHRFKSLLRFFGVRTEAVIKLQEAAYACLPEFEACNEKPFLLHFKGPRKSMLEACCHREGLRAP